jgi:hypothetical protein
MVVLGSASNDMITDIDHRRLRREDYRARPAAGLSLGPTRS